MVDNAMLDTISDREDEDMALTVRFIKFHSSIKAEVFDNAIEIDDVRF